MYGTKFSYTILNVALSPISRRLSIYIALLFLFVRNVDLFSLVSVITLLTTCPLMVFYFHVACTHYDCALTSPIVGILSGDITLNDFLKQLPPVTPEGFKIVLPWVAFQVCKHCKMDIFELKLFVCP